MAKRMMAGMLAGVALLGVAGQAMAVPAAWSGAFGAPPIGYEPKSRDALPRPFHDETVRQVVRVAIGGTALRVRLTNELGQAPLRIGAASIVRLDGNGRPVAGTLRPLRFDGAKGVVIPAGAPWLSDAVEGPVAAGTDYAISLHYPDESAPPAHAQMVDVAPGDQTGSPTLTRSVHARASGLVSEIDVASSPARRVIVTFGDSITEGAASTPGAHMSWPDQLGRRLAQEAGQGCRAIVNAGISGNRLLHDGRGPNALARFDRDVLSVPGVDTVVLLEGINDIGASAMPEHASEGVSAEAIIAAERELIDRAHTHKLRVIGGTLLPFEGAGYFTAEGEAKRATVNRWIRTSHAFDAVIDFDAAMRDPAHPTRFIESAQSGDHLHPNDAGYTRMAAAAEPTLRAQACPAGG